jgi:hypothetical protein
MLSLFFEVPQGTDRDDLEQFLGNYQFAINRDHSDPSKPMDPLPCPRDSGTTDLYFIKGPQVEFDKLDQDAQQQGYQLWEDSQMQSFGTCGPQGGKK